MIGIIGAGPAGGHLACLLARKGFDVTLFEEHEIIGKPVQCTGIVTKLLFDMVKKDDSYMVNELKRANIIGPNVSIDISLKEYVIDRHRFDCWLAEKAASYGARIKTRHQFYDYLDGKAYFKTGGKTASYDIDILIGADGPNSIVAKTAGFYQPRDFFIGIQATARGSYDKDCFNVFFGPLAPDFFAWMVPETNTMARVGIASRAKAREVFNNFMKKVEAKIVGMQAGPIPYYVSGQKAQNGNVYLVGDAAGFVKATTGGGIITGMISSEILADCINKEKNYDKTLWKLRKELWIHKKIRQALDNFNDKDYDALLTMMSSKGIKQLLYEHPREYPSKFLLRIFFKQPKLLKFAGKLFKSK